MRRIATAALTATALVAAGCGASAEAPSTGSHESATEQGAAAPKPSAFAEARRERPAVAYAGCAPAADNCAAVTGRVLYVEAVDPDGDGDAHYVLVGGHVTAPGVSVIDVERTLRPRRLPRAGDLVSAAGPVYKGSYGQRQIQAVELHYARR